MNEDSIRDGMRAFFEARGPSVQALEKVRKKLQDLGCEAVLFGGVVRDALLYGAEARPRDIDIVYSGAGFMAVAEAFGVRKTNRMGGIKFEVDGVKVDAWSLARTWAFYIRKFKNPKFDDLLWSSMFNVEAGLYNILPDDGRVYDGGMLDCLSSRILELNFPETPAPALLLVRAYFFAKRFQLSFGPKLRAYIDENLPIQLGKLEDAQLQYFGQMTAPVAEIREGLLAGGFSSTSLPER